MNNLSQADRFIRAILGIAIIVAYSIGILSGYFGMIILIGGVVFIATSVLKYCPIYDMLDWSTYKEVQKQH